MRFKWYGHEFNPRIISIGHDIEFALLNTKGKPVSAIPYVQGTKHDPWNVDGGNVQRDNIAYEIAVQYNFDVMLLISNIRKILQYATNRIPKGYRLACIPSAIYDPKELKHSEAQEFGCDADYDAKTGYVNEFSGIVDPCLRSFGFHVHTGNPHVDPRIHALASDMTLGLFSCLKDNSEAALQRRQLYGKPSCYRVKPYGVEYRTLSNYFCKSPRLLKVVYCLNYVAWIISVNNPRLMFENVDIYEVSDVIMNGDTARATEIFFKHVYAHADPDFQRFIVDELEYDNYKELEVEWSIDTTQQSLTRHQALRQDYYQPPTIEKEMVANG